MESDNFRYRGTFQWTVKHLQPLTVLEPSTRPPSCTTPRQLTIYVSVDWRNSKEADLCLWAWRLVHQLSKHGTLQRHDQNFDGRRRGIHFYILIEETTKWHTWLHSILNIQKVIRLFCPECSSPLALSAGIISTSTQVDFLGRRLQQNSTVVKSYYHILGKMIRSNSTNIFYVA